MKTLQGVKRVTISKNEMKYLRGGTAVDGSFNLMGSVFSYSGSVDLTADSSTKFTLTVAEFNGTSYVSDFCGQASYDGGSAAGCAQFRNGSWALV